MVHLTPREQTIIECLHQYPAISNAEMAERFGKAEKTIENQLNTLYKKLEINGDSCQKRIQLVLWAQTQGA